MSASRNPVGWFEIPVKNIERAQSFYEAILNIEMKRFDMGVLKMSWFPSNVEAHGSSGSLVEHEVHYTPKSDGGVIIYLECDDVALALEKAKTLGGEIIQEKKQISPEHGYMGLLIDCEGNKIALHSAN